MKERIAGWNTSLSKILDNEQDHDYNNDHFQPESINGLS